MLNLRTKLMMALLLFGSQAFEMLGIDPAMLAQVRARRKPEAGEEPAAPAVSKAPGGVPVAPGGGPRVPTPPPAPGTGVPGVPRLVIGGGKASPEVATAYDLVKGYIEGAAAPADILAAYKLIGETLGVIKAPCGKNVGDACTYRNPCCADSGLTCVDGACKVPEVPLPCSHVVGTICDARHTCCEEDSLVCGEKGTCEKEIKLDQHCAKTIDNLSKNPLAKALVERELKKAKAAGGLDYFADYTSEQQCFIKREAQAAGQPYEDYALAQRYIKNKGKAPEESGASGAVAAAAPAVPARPTTGLPPAMATAAPAVVKPAAVTATVAAPTPATVAAATPAATPAAAPTPSGAAAAPAVTDFEAKYKNVTKSKDIKKAYSALMAITAPTAEQQAEIAYLKTAYPTWTASVA